jgi:hypothetical protein
MSGFRVKKLLLFNAEGRLAPIMVTCKGLTSMELKPGHTQDMFGSPDGYFLAKFMGLGVGGSVNDLRTGLILDNTACETAILAEVLKAGKEGLEEARLKYFAKQLKGKLATILHCRLFGTTAKPPGVSFPNKGKLIDPQNERDCLILRAFNARTLIPKLKAIVAVEDTNENTEQGHSTPTEEASTAEHLPSYYLQSDDFLKSIVEVFSHHDLVKPTVAVTDPHLENLVRNIETKMTEDATTPNPLGMMLGRHECTNHGRHIYLLWARRRGC